MAQAKPCGRCPARWSAMSSRSWRRGGRCRPILPASTERRWPGTRPSIGSRRRWKGSGANPRRAPLPLSARVVADLGQATGSGIAHRRRGQPLVFLLTVLCAWSAARVIHHWPVIYQTPSASVPVPMTSQAQADAAPRLRVSAHRRALSPGDAPRALRLAHGARLAKPRGGSAGSVVEPPGWQAQPQDAELSLLPLLPAPPRAADQVPLSQAPGAWLPPVPSGADGSRAHAGRWSVYGWSLVRQGTSGSILAPGGQYGGSQAGLGGRWAMGSAAYRPALYARATGALATSDERTLALGLSVRPVPRLPFDLAVERRVPPARAQ